MNERSTDALDVLGRRVARAQDEWLAGADTLSEARQRLFHARAATPMNRWFVAAPAGALLAAAAALLVIFAGGTEPLTFEVGHASADAGGGTVGEWIEVTDELPMRFSDGSSLLLSPATRLRVTRLDATGADISLERGWAAVSITPREKSQWRLFVGPFQVTVTGTRFDVGWDAVRQDFRLDLHDGSVWVSGPTLEGAQAVVAGQSVRVSLARVDGDAERQVAARSRTPSSIATEEPTAAAEVVDPETAADSVAPRRRSRRETEPGEDSPPISGEPDELTAQAGAMTWQELIDAERYPEAVAAAELVGFSSACAAANGRDLLRLGDAARYARNTGRSRQAYAATRRRFAGSGFSSRAAYALGLLEFRDPRNLAAAVTWFETYLKERPRGPLAREAVGRIMEAHDRLGNQEAARRYARKYLARYPDGPQVEMARRIGYR
jgi:hypothetical protein